MRTRINTSKAPFRVHLLPTVAVSVFLLFAANQKAEGLTIIRDFIGGAPPTNSNGAGNLMENFNAAADVWEQIIRDDHVLMLHFGWAPNGGGEHYLIAQGGTPNRETEGTILFNNDNVAGHHHYYLDPTPRLNEEYPNYTQIAQDMGGGALNVTRVFGGGTGDAGSEDLFTTALHEIGHALGMSVANTSFIADSAGGRIDITAPRPFRGTTVPLAAKTSHIYNVADRVLMGGFGAGERVLPSTLDIIALAELSHFQKLNFNLSPDRLNLFTNFGLTVSTSHDAVDVNPSSVGVQVHAGTTVHYSGAASDFLSTSLTWQWLYQVNGSEWTVVLSGSGPVPTIKFTFGADSVGSTYVFTLSVVSGPRSGFSHSTIAVE
jgi:hypothetical protein